MTIKEVLDILPHWNSYETLHAFLTKFNEYFISVGFQPLNRTNPTLQ